MADRETIIETRNGDGMSSILVAVIVLVLVGFAVWFFFNRPGAAPSGVTVDIPAVTIEAPAPAPN